MSQKEFIYETFSTLHAVPEIGFKEVKTSTFLADSLAQMGYAVERNVGTTGIVAYLESGNPGENFALRADMDALDFSEAGQEVCVHACGHDANSTMVLTAAKIAAERGIEKGRLYIVFQQAEELVGAIEMIETGKLDMIDRMVGIHLRPDAEAKLGQGISALSHGAGYFVKFKICGTLAHGARPHLGVNAAETAVAIVGLVNAIKERADIAHSAKLTQIHTQGNGANTIPAVCYVTFDVRSASDEIADSLVQKIINIAEHVALANGATIEDVSINGVAAANLDEELSALCDQAMREVLGDTNCLGAKATTGGEDIHYFTKLRNIKMGYVGIGGDIKHGLHNKQMTFDHTAMEIGVAVLEKIVSKTVGLK